MMGETSGLAQTRSSRPLRLVASGLLIVTPVALSLAVPLYQRTTPALGDIPFFYWFQMAMAVVAAVATSIVYRLLFTGDDDEGDA